MKAGNKNSATRAMHLSELHHHFSTQYQGAGEQWVTWVTSEVESDISSPQLGMQAVGSKFRGGNLRGRYKGA